MICVVDRQVLGRHEVVGEPLELTVEDQPRARLEDEGALAEQARVLEDLGAAATGVQDDLDLGAGAGLQRAHAEQREAPLPVAQERRPASQEGPVEVAVDAAERHAGGASLTSAR